MTSIANINLSNVIIALQLIEFAKATGFFTNPDSTNVQVQDLSEAHNWYESTADVPSILRETLAGSRLIFSAASA
jgi:hypothetical protein